MSIIKEQISMQAHAQSINAISGEIIAGPNGDFISFTLKNGDTSTLPVGGRSQGMAKPSELSVISVPPNEKYPEGGYVATVNQYVSQGVESF
tara:strand:- start:1114 stop:1389 length:276 start_codon:yes stop_codon:yes gene_type:complete